MEIPTEKILEIQRELGERRQREQAVRQEFYVFFMSGKTREEIAASPLVAEMRKVDAENVAYLKTVLSEWGWVDAERFGPEAAQAVFLIVQHSDGTELMGQALPFIEADVKAKRIGGSSYALLYDRYNLRINRKQRFGSQVTYDDRGEPVAQNLEDPDKVDELRRAFGMEPLTEYLIRFRKNK